MPGYIDKNEIEKLSIVDFLAKLGHQPIKKSGREYFYHSMLRETTRNTPSFTVWDEGGKWIDRGGPNHTGIFGGGIIQLARALWPGLNFIDILQKIQYTFDHPQAVRFPNVENEPNQNPVDKKYFFEFSHKQKLGSNFVLTKYLEERGIKDVAEGLIWEVYFTNKADTNKNKKFYGLGWQNRKGNWEVTNSKRFKTCIGDKDISVIPGTNDHVVVFEGFMDYLSWKKLAVPSLLPTAIVLNSITMIGRAETLLHTFGKIDLYLDNDEPGSQSTNILKKTFPHAIDRRNEYYQFKDYNEKLLDILRNTQLGIDDNFQSRNRRYR